MVKAYQIPRSLSLETLPNAAGIYGTQRAPRRIAVQPSVGFADRESIAASTFDLFREDAPRSRTVALRRRGARPVIRRDAPRAVVPTPLGGSWAESPAVDPGAEEQDRSGAAPRSANSSPSNNAHRHRRAGADVTVTRPRRWQPAPRRRRSPRGRGPPGSRAAGAPRAQPEPLDHRVHPGARRGVADPSARSTSLRLPRESRKSSSRARSAASCEQNAHVVNAPVTSVPHAVHDSRVTRARSGTPGSRWVARARVHGVRTTRFENAASTSMAWAPDPSTACVAEPSASTWE